MGDRMKVIVFSDTHGMTAYMEQAMQKEQPDYILHLGDYVRDAEWLERKYSWMPLLYVKGNCDIGSDAPEFFVLTLLGHKIFLCHGHRYGVKYDLLRMCCTAQEQGAEICLFGHTHEAHRSVEREVLMVNPGPCSDCGLPSYAILTLEKGSADAEIKYIHQKLRR